MHGHKTDTSMTNISKVTGSGIFINLHTDYHTSYNPNKTTGTTINLHVNGRTRTHHFSVPEFLGAKNQMFLLQHTSAFPLSLLWCPEDWEFYYTPWLEHIVKDTYLYFLTECNQQHHKGFQCFFSWAPCTNCQQQQIQNPAAVTVYSGPSQVSNNILPFRRGGPS